MAAEKAFCLHCGVGVGFDDQGCCTGCGCEVCGMVGLRALLATHGYLLVERCPKHELLCMDAHCDVREKAFA